MTETAQRDERSLGAFYAEEGGLAFARRLLLTEPDLVGAATQIGAFRVRVDVESSRRQP